MPRRLSRRERQVIEGIAAGRTTKEIASLLGIAPSTVDWHIANALAKLRAANRAEAVAIVLRRGDLAPGRAELLLALLTGAVGRWRAVAAAILIAVAVPMLVASDSAPRGVPGERPASPAEGAPRTSDRPALPSATARVSGAPAATVPGATTGPGPAPTVDSAAPSVTPTVTPTLGPSPSPAVSQPLSPVPTLVAPTASIPLSTGPSPTLAPTLVPSISPLPSLAPLPTASALPDLTPLASPSASPLPTAPAIPSAVPTPSLPSLP